jgi:hypothetical protein
VTISSPPDDYLTDALGTVGSDIEVSAARWRWVRREPGSEAKFDDVVQGVRKRMREIAVLVFDGGLVSSLREYWASEQIGQAKKLARAD